MKLLKKIYSNKKLLKQLFWYIVVGVGGTVLDFSIFYLCLHFQVSPLVAQWVAGLGGFTHNHVWQHFYVFEHATTLKKTYIQSLLVSVIFIFISGPFLIFVKHFLPYFWMSKIVVMGVLFGVLFIIRRQWIFQNKKEELL